MATEMKTLQRLSEDLRSAVERAAPGIVRVEARRRYPLSGTVWSGGLAGAPADTAADIVVTSSRAVEREEGIRLGLENGEPLAATFVGRDPGTDLAVLRVEPGVLQAPLWQDEKPDVGALVLMLGRPGRGVQAGLGIVSRLGEAWRTAAGSRVDSFIQADARPFPGFSGGALLSASGAVLGLNSSALLRGMPATVPSATVQRVVEALLSHGRVRRGYLGVGVQPVRLPESLRETLEQETGLLITSVQPGSAAEEAGLVLGDALVALEDQPLRHLDDLQPYLAEDRVGERLPARVLRGGELKEVTLPISERP